MKPFSSFLESEFQEYALLKRMRYQICSELNCAGNVFVICCYYFKSCQLAFFSCLSSFLALLSTNDVLDKCNQEEMTRLRNTSLSCHSREGLSSYSHRMDTSILNQCGFALRSQMKNDVGLANSIEVVYVAWF